MSESEEASGSEPTPQREVPEAPQSPEFEMRRRAAAVLEVLGGAKAPSEAAQALSISLPCYYLLEARALEGLIAACEPRSKGRGSREGKSVSTLRRDNERLRQELARAQALSRAIHRATGMPEGDGDDETGDGRRRRRHRPRARALRAARALSTDPAPAPPSPGVEPPH
jgi:hypothetical protein